MRYKQLLNGYAMWEEQESGLLLNSPAIPLPTPFWDAKTAQNSAVGQYGCMQSRY
jgi:hypothetical protein